MKIAIGMVAALWMAAVGARAEVQPIPGGENPLAMPAVGYRSLRVISPTVLELCLVQAKKPGVRLEQWDFVGDDGQAKLPAAQAFKVSAGGKAIGVSAVGFKRRVLYMPLKRYDLRVASWLYLQLAAPIAEGAEVSVTSLDRTLWPAAVRYQAKADPMRWSPAIHANQVGYLPGQPKKAMVGYYLGSLGELDARSLTSFSLIDARTGKAVYRGALKARPDRGYTYATLPYQQVREADFSAFDKPGEYRLWVAGLGVSLPFRIDRGTAAAFARVYALGLYHQRCGAANELPFTRFTHAPCHTAPAEVPTMANASVQRQLSGESANYKDNPRHTAPQLKDVNSSLYPFVRQGKIDVSGGHHDAGDYSKYVNNSAQLIHYLVFAADALPGAGDLDNLGLPESGDGKSDLLQLAKWEADFLAKMQDDDGGFYFLVYPRDRPYEDDVTPDHGDPQVVFPKTTSVTAAAVAALAETASSPRFKKTWPEAAALYLAKAKKGWAFLERAWAKYGMDGSYQKITHYGDFAMHDDEIAWAATELYLATGEAKYHDKLRAIYDPADKNTMHWGWERLFGTYGNVARSYVFAVRTGRLTEQQIDPVYLAKCRTELLALAQDEMDWASASAYGTSLPIESKRFRTAGWYFSTSQAFDIAVADLLDPRPERMQAILTDLSYEAGCNPVNVTFVTGMGWKRQREIVHQYATNDRRVLPPSGIPLGSVQEGFMYLYTYKSEPGAQTYPPDGAADKAYAFYDRWGDAFNTMTEFTIPIQGRSLATTAWLMAGTPLKSQAWRAARATIAGAPARPKAGVPIAVTLKAQGVSLSEAQIVWEAADQEPVFGSSFRFTPKHAGPCWIEAEAMLPDGRRVFGVLELTVEP